MKQPKHDIGNTFKMQRKAHLANLLIIRYLNSIHEKLTDGEESNLENLQFLIGEQTVLRKIHDTMDDVIENIIRRSRKDPFEVKAGFHAHACSHSFVWVHKDDDFKCPEAVHLANHISPHCGEYVTDKLVITSNIRKEIHAQWHNVK